MAVSMFPSAQDDLAALFARTMTLNPSLALQIVPQQNVSQHYSHASHLARLEAQNNPAATARPRTRLSCDELLRQKGIDPGALSVPQFQLFRIADDEQKKRLLELWAIFPPTPDPNHPELAWTETSEQQEIDIARSKFAQAQMQAEQEQQQLSDGDTSMNLDDQTPSSPTRPMDDWASGCTEPYMMSGYEALMRADYERTHSRHAVYRGATDPAYGGPMCVDAMEMA